MLKQMLQKINSDQLRFILEFNQLKRCFRHTEKFRNDEQIQNALDDVKNIGPLY